MDYFFSGLFGHSSKGLNLNEYCGNLQLLSDWPDVLDLTLAFEVERELSP